MSIIISKVFQQQEQKLIESGTVLENTFNKVLTCIRTHNAAGDMPFEHMEQLFALTNQVLKAIAIHEQTLAVLHRTKTLLERYQLLEN